MLFGLGINDKDSNCKYFIGKNEEVADKDETKRFNLRDGVYFPNFKYGKYFEPLSGKTNINNFKDRTSKCEWGAYIAIFKVKNYKITEFIVNSSEGQLLFSGKYRNGKLNGEVYIDRHFDDADIFSFKSEYVNGIPNGKMTVYYHNGKIYKTFNIKGKNKYSFIDYMKYVVGRYNVYDINTGEVIYTGEIINGNGEVRKYSYETGILESKYTLKNRKIEGSEIQYDKDGRIKGEIIFKNDEPIENRVYYKNGDKNINGIL